MTVAELIKELEEMPQDYNVVFMTNDEFGEGFLVDTTSFIRRDKSKQIELY